VQTPCCMHLLCVHSVIGLAGGRLHSDKNVAVVVLNVFPISRC
jgi:hypothetical protein